MNQKTNRQLLLTKLIICTLLIFSTFSNVVWSQKLSNESESSLRLPPVPISNLETPMAPKPKDNLLMTPPITTQSSDQELIESVKNIPSLDDGYKYIALTFDDGPHSKNDWRILNALNQVNGHATFFMVGSAIPYNVDIVQAILNQGSEIGNHSYSHPAFTTLSAAQIASEINDTSALIQYYTGYTPHLVRPPYGDINDVVLANLPNPVIMWSVDTLDWKYRDPYYVYEQVRYSPAGSIVLLHSIHPTTATAIEMVLQDMYNDGYRFVTVSELFEIYGIDLTSFTIYYSAN